LRLGVLFSGGGRTLDNLARRCRDGSLPASIAVAVSSHPQAGGIARAARLDIPCRVLDYREWGEGLSEGINKVLEEAGCDLVLLAGFIRHYRIPLRHEGRVLNIHPALLPAFGGKGLYGGRVHRAVLAAGVRFPVAPSTS
jgi:phosphoribosylglycinamide formyltransferase-1